MIFFLGILIHLDLQKGLTYINIIPDKNHLYKFLKPEQNLLNNVLET